jgi:hypothetical protein
MFPTGSLTDRLVVGRNVTLTLAGKGEKGSLRRRASEVSWVCRRSWAQPRRDSAEGRQWGTLQYCKVCNCKLYTVIQKIQLTIQYPVYTVTLYLDFILSLIKVRSSNNHSHTLGKTKESSLLIICSGYVELISSPNETSTTAMHWWTETVMTFTLLSLRRANGGTLFFCR